MSRRRVGVKDFERERNDRLLIVGVDGKLVVGVATIGDNQLRQGGVRAIGTISPFLANGRMSSETGPTIGRPPARSSTSGREGVRKDSSNSN